jgi:radical SAM protein with 4Fe4S-binding SPASM domain
MDFKRIEYFIRSTPVLKKAYEKNVGRMKAFLYAANRRVPLIKTPLFVHWHATYDCNLSCAHCGASAGGGGGNEVKTDQIRRAVQEMGEMGVRRFIVTGGEPLVRGDVFEILKEARKAGIPRLTLATNGMLVERFKEELKRADLYSVHVSVDGPSQANDRLRGVAGAFGKAWASLDFFKTIGVKERVINTLAHKCLLGELEAFLEEVVHSSATLWNIQTPLAVGRATGNEAMSLTREELIFLFKFMLRARERFPVQIANHAGFLGPLALLLRPRLFFCGAGHENCAILANGEVVGCQELYNPAHSMGNIKEESFKEIWLKNLGRFKLPSRPEECKSCRYYPACQGGCGAVWEVEGRCLKDVWESDDFRTVSST